MKWYLASLSKSEQINEPLSIMHKVKEEFKLKNLSEFTNNLEGINYSYVLSDNEDPLIKENNSKITIVGDINIHNIEVLISKYSIKEDIKLNNENLIRMMYIKSGINFLEDLVGEFSFVLIDNEMNLTYLVRDHMGIKPLFWIETTNQYIIASDIFLMEDYFNFIDIDYSYFTEFVKREGSIDIPLTPFKNVKRIPSGHYVCLDNKHIKLTQYWNLAEIKDSILFNSEEDYVQEFKNILYKSVTKKLVKGNANAVMLSGGLDSTSIYALAKEFTKTKDDYKISSVSAIFDELTECDEREYFEELLAKNNSTGEYVQFDEIFMYEKFPDNTPFSYEPHVSSLSYEFAYNLTKRSVEKGKHNVLSGFGGDQLLTGSLYTSRDDLKKFRIRKTFSSLTKYSIQTNSSAFKNMIHYTIKADVASEFVSSPLYRKEVQKKLKKIKTYNQKELFYQLMNSKAHLYTDRVIGGITGANISHPFLDRRLVEYVYKIPGDLRFRAGTGNSKYILRRAMRDDIPSKIISRTNKTTHLAYTYKSLRKNWNNIFEALKNPYIVKELHLLTIEEWHTDLQKWRNGLETSSNFWPLLAVEYWLTKYFKRSNEEIV